MGNESSKKPETALVAEKPKPVLDTRFLALSKDGSPIHKELLTELFGDLLGSKLLAFVGVGGVITAESFTEKAVPLFGQSTDVYVRLAGDGRCLLQCCCEAASIPVDAFIETLLSSMSGDTIDDIVAWKHEMCPRLCDGLQRRVQEVCGMRVPLVGFPSFAHSQCLTVESSVLSPMQMWFTRCAIPSAFLAHEPGSAWTRLYNSSREGLSASRFESSIFGYRGLTVCVFTTVAGIFVIGVDQEWRSSTQSFGGSDSFLLQLSPSILFKQASKMLICNFKQRASNMGISFGTHFRVDQNLSDVMDLEVWGCSETSTLKEHQKLNQWKAKQAEKQQKVPLPGNWDDNADKAILEMAGFQFSSEKRD